MTDASIATLTDAGCIALSYLALLTLPAEAGREAVLFVLLLKVVWKSVIELFFCSGAASVPFAGAKVHTPQLLTKLFRKFFKKIFGDIPKIAGKRL